MDSNQTGTTTLNYSQEFIKQKQRIVMVSALCLPLTMMAFAFFTAKITYGVSLIRTNEYSYELFSSGVQMLLGLYLLLFTPISKVAGVRHRKFELVGGSFLAVAGAAMLMMEAFGV